MRTFRNGWRWIAVGALGACGQPSQPRAVTLPSASATTTAPPVVHLGHPPSDRLLAWPVAPFTPAQIAEVKRCDAKDAGAGAACEQAVHAAACVASVDRSASPPASCVAAYRAALSGNPAFAFSSALLRGWFGRVPIVAPPPSATRALTSVALDYVWDGLGKPVKWSLVAADLRGRPALTTTGATAKPWSPDVAARVAALGASLGDFLPIPKPLAAVDCTDNYPKWTAKLAFDDGTTIELTTNGSNLLGLGGPWQTTIGGVTYLQLAPGFAAAVGKLVEALGLPIGEPMGETCSGYDLEGAVLGK